MTEENRFLPLARMLSPAEKEGTEPILQNLGKFFAGQFSGAFDNIDWF